MDQSVIIIFSIILSVGLIGFLVALIFIIYAAIELKRAASSLSNFLKVTEDRMTPVLEEAELSLRNIKKISDDIGKITDNVKDVTIALNETAKNIRDISNIVEDIKRGASLRIMGLKAGIKTAINVLIQEISSKKTKKEV
jgi:uncharacterized protein YoxC